MRPSNPVHSPRRPYEASRHQCQIASEIFIYIYIYMYIYIISLLCLASLCRFFAYVPHSSVLLLLSSTFSAFAAAAASACLCLPLDQFLHRKYGYMRDYLSISCCWPYSLISVPLGVQSTPEAIGLRISMAKTPGPCVQITNGPWNRGCVLQNRSPSPRWAIPIPSHHIPHVPLCLQPNMVAIMLLASS